MTNTHQKITALINVGNLDQASAACIELLRSAPKDSEAWSLLSRVSLRVGNVNMAISCLLKAIDYTDDKASFMIELVEVYVNLQAWLEARRVLSLCLQQHTLTCEQWSVLGWLFYQCNDVQAAMTCYIKALALDESHYLARFNLAAMKRFTGDYDEAEKHYQILLMHPNVDHEVFCNLALLKRHANSSELMAQLNICRDKHNPTVESDVAIHYATGKVLEDAANYKEAFAHYDSGARRMRADLNYQVENDIALMAQLVATASQVSPVTLDTKLKPVFIVSMPRTGSTLVERMISSHCEVHSGGELNFLPMAILNAVEKSLHHDIYGIDAQVAQSLVNADYKIIAQKYLINCQQYLNVDGVFTDKLPLNFLFIGVIKSAIPHAKIIHVTRDPMDTAFANFKTFFKNGYNYSYNWNDIARYMVSYKRTMAAWHRLYPNQILDVAYESIVSDAEHSIARMLDYCGLDDDPNCAQFFNNESPSQTASASQVREPVHQRSRGRWQKYRALLSGAASELAEQGLVSLDLASEEGNGKA